MSGFVRAAFVVSGQGRVAGPVIGACLPGGSLCPRIEVGLVVEDRPGTIAAQTARELGVPTKHVVTCDRGQFPTPTEFGEGLLEWLRWAGVDLVILSGCLSRIPDNVVREYRGRILNHHPGPLPEFGGQGLYGLHVHQAVLEAGLTETKAVVHHVDEEVDTGAIIAESVVAIEPGDTAQSLQQRVLPVEQALLLEVLGDQALDLVREHRTRAFRSPVPLLRR